MPAAAIDDYHVKGEHKVHPYIGLVIVTSD